jgi:uncharacterized CHY-type Zn-finger protein
MKLVFTAPALADLDDVLAFTAGRRFRRGGIGAAMSVPVVGIDLDGETRCAHWHSALDIVAIRMKCCGIYYACKDCHTVLADHPAEVWPRTDWNDKAVLCGACGAELSIHEYLACGSRCPRCGAGFNPGCRLHHRFYFEE